MSDIREYQCAKCGTKYTDNIVPPNDGCGGRIDITIDLELLKCPHCGKKITPKDVIG